MITISNKKPLRKHLIELWNYRGLLYFLTWRHVLVRYKQTFFGILWSVLKPLLATAILSVVFHKLIGLSDSGVPYALVVMSGLLVWQLFANAVSSGSTALVADHSLVTRTYVPRIALPMSAMLVSFIEAFITMGMLVMMMVYYHQEFSMRLILVVPLLILTFLLAMSVALTFTALHARYRDFNYITPFFLQMGFYLSPVAFLTVHIPEAMREYFYLNPLVGLIEALRWAMFGGYAPLPVEALGTSVVMTGTLLILSLIYFYRNERTIADVI